jgi:cell division protein FtsL
MTQKQKQRNKIFTFPKHFFFRRSFAPNWKLINQSMLMVIIALIVGYVASVNELSIQGFTLSQMKNKVNEIEKETEKLDLTALDLGSYEMINKRAQELNMVKVDKIDYIEVVNGSVAKK